MVGRRHAHGASFILLLALGAMASCDPADHAADAGPTATDSGSDLDPDIRITDGGTDLVADSGAGSDPDSGTSVAAGPPCASPSGSGTTHAGSVTADETWTAADSPHVVTSVLHITGATVTIEPCAVVRLAAGVTIDMQESAAGQPGELIAHGEYVGTTRRPIVFEREDAAEPWGSLRALPEGRIDLEHVDLFGGGDHATAASNGGTLIAEGVGGNRGVTDNLRVVDVLIEDSAGFGVSLVARAAFTDNSDSLVIRGAGSVPSPSNVDTRYPVYVTGAALSTIPSGSYTGNARDEIFVAQVSAMRDPSVSTRAARAATPGSAAGRATTARRCSSETGFQRSHSSKAVRSRIRQAAASSAAGGRTTWAPGPCSRCRTPSKTWARARSRSTLRRTAPARPPGRTTVTSP